MRLILLLAALLGAVANALSAVGSRLLVVLEDETLKPKYSTLLSDLESRGFQVSIKSPKGTDLALFEHNQRSYDHILLLPPSSKAYGPQLSAQFLIDFINKEGNVLLALSAGTPTPTAISSLLLELGITLPPGRSNVVVDHFSYDKSSGDAHDILLVDRPSKLKAGVKNFFGGSGRIAIPRAVPQILDNASPLLSTILKAPNTAYTYDTKEEKETVEELFASGSQISLATAFQARNSARFTVIGSAEALQDDFFKKDNVNKDFTRQLTKWAFKEVGVLKVQDLYHHLASDKPVVSGKANSSSVLNPKIYRIKEEVTYTVALSEWSNDKWVPFTPPAGDSLQLEFSMLSPFHRLALDASKKTDTAAIYTKTFMTPDQHGIFNFRLNYKRPYLTTVDEKREVTVRHFAHDEYTRSYAISGAWTWIAGIGVTVVGWLAFVLVWLYSKPIQEGGVKKTQ